MVLRQQCSVSIVFVTALMSVAMQEPPSPSEVSRASELDAGFRLLYELKPRKLAGSLPFGGRRIPEDPLGSVSEAASYLFEECYRQGVLTSEFFRTTSVFWAR